MIKVKFAGNKGMYDVEFHSTSEKITLKGKKFPKQVDHGFKAYRQNGDLLGDYTDYVISTKIQGGFEFYKRGKENEKNRKGNE